MSFPRYPAYKDSGVEWVGEVPAHWTVMPLKRDIEFVTSGARGWAENYADEGDLFLRIGNLTRDSIRLDLSDIQRVVVPEGAEVDRTQVQAGDILFSITAYLGSVAVVPEALGRAFVSQHVALVRLGKKHITAEWSAYVAISYVGKTHLETTGYGGTKVQLSLADVVSLPMVVPPIDEQVLLVRFLEHETAKIEALVAEQERLIELLKEKRQAIISHAVTKGLDPSVPMKESGVEWLGEVPAHWEVKQIRQITQILRGKFTHRPRNDPAFYDGEYPFIQTGDVTGAKRYITEFKQTLNDKGAAVSKEFPRGTLVMTIAANIGDVAVLDFPAYFPDSIVGLVPGSNVDLMFLFYLMKSMKQPLEMNSTISTQMNLNVEQIGSLFACCPPIDEQRQIFQRLEALSKQLDCLIEEARAATTLLQERRTALISATVTGQIDVRGWVPAATAA